MNNKEFQKRYRFPLLWLDQADRHLYSARVISIKRKRLLSNNTVLSDKMEERCRALSETYLFLMGMAIENLIKGLIISKEPAIKELSEFRNKYGWNDNHNLSSMIKSNFDFLVEDEIDTILRVEEYVKWAGKYPLPKDEKKFKTVDYNLKDKDEENLEKLFSDIMFHIKLNWENKQNEYFQCIEL